MITWKSSFLWNLRNRFSWFWCWYPTIMINTLCENSIFNYIFPDERNMWVYLMPVKVNVSRENIAAILSLVMKLLLVLLYWTHFSNSVLTKIIFTAYHDILTWHVHWSGDISFFADYSCLASLQSGHNNIMKPTNLSWSKKFNLLSMISLHWTQYMKNLTIIYTFFNMG